MKIALTIAALALAAAAWAADIPKALDKGVVRLGPLLSGAFEKTRREWWHEYGPYSETARRGGGGGYFWAQYDGSWYGYEARLGAVVFRGDGGTYTDIDWENEYHMYLVKGKYRPYFTPSAGLRRTEDPGGGETRPLFGAYFGIRLNSPVSPFYMTFGGGYKFAENSYAVIQNRYYLGLTPTVALRIELEAGSEFEGDDSAFARLNVGPSFSF